MIQYTYQPGTPTGTTPQGFSPYGQMTTPIAIYQTEPFPGEQCNNADLTHVPDGFHQFNSTDKSLNDPATQNLQMPIFTSQACIIPSMQQIPGQTPMGVSLEVANMSNSPQQMATMAWPQDQMMWATEQH